MKKITYKIVDRFEFLKLGIHKVRIQMNDKLLLNIYQIVFYNIAI